MARICRKAAVVLMQCSYLRMVDPSILTGSHLIPVKLNALMGRNIEIDKGRRKVAI